MVEGLQPPRAALVKEGDLKIDYSSEAVELRKVFRSLSLSDRRLVTDFVHMLAKRP